MKNTVLTLVTALGFILPMASVSHAATEVDANGDGVLTIDEVQAVFPEVTADSFTAMDLNADGALDDDEVVAAQQAGMMPPIKG
jgi:hypothetical protein